jgi:mono/diheme cytochrome c family protein
MKDIPSCASSLAFPPIEPIIPARNQTSQKDACFLYLYEENVEEGVMLKSFLLLSAAIIFAFTPTPFQDSTPQEAAPAPEAVPAATATNPVKPTAESQAKAKNIYQIDCAMCHGDNGDGKTDLAKSIGAPVPDFTDPKTLTGVPDGQLFGIIRNGKDKMPPEAAGRANDTMTWNLIIYLRGMAKPAQ